MTHLRFLLSRPWFLLALIAVTLLLAACPSGGKSGY
jgi:hypothetical protein